MAKPADVPSTRHVLDSEAVLRELGYLRELSGTWEGEGFNLIARPNFRDQANLYLQLNQTRETLVITPIGSAIPNRGFGQGDIELFGLSYLQKIHDHGTGGALHLEPGLWITQPCTTYPRQYPPPNGQIIARMASIPHGSVVLAQGSATGFSGPPTLPTKTQVYNGSVFHSFNSTPLAAAPPVINAAGSSQKLTAARFPMPRFDEYDLSIRKSAVRHRTPSLPQRINGEVMQDVINDPIRLLQAAIRKQVSDGSTFQGVALNIATQATVTFRLHRDSSSTDPTVNVQVTSGAGRIGNILFLEGGEPAGAKGPNAQTGLVYATFWIEKVTPKHGLHFMQLQYAQMAVLNFPIFKLLNPPEGGSGKLVTLGWPHISIATLRKAF